MLKVELHAHTDGDPADRITHTPGICSSTRRTSDYDALAVTLHDRYFDPAPHAADAARCGVLLLSGIERTIQGKHLLLINFPEDVSRVGSFDDVRALKARTNGLVVAPHPFYPVRSALRSQLDALASLIDAVEVNAMFTRRSTSIAPRWPGRARTGNRSSATRICTCSSRWERRIRWWTRNAIPTPSARPSAKAGSRSGARRSRSRAPQGSSRRCRGEGSSGATGPGT